MRSGLGAVIFAAVAFGGNAKVQEGFRDVIASGGWHTCALRESGEVSCWGANDHGQSSPPKGNFIGVASGKGHSCAVKTDGQVECWGSNEYHQCDSPDAQFSQVACGAAHTCALSVDGEVLCWGSDEHSRSSGAPSGRFVGIAAAGGHSCALEESGKAHCWGFNEYNQTDVPDQKFKQIAPGEATTNLHQDVSGRFHHVGPLLAPWTCQAELCAGHKLIRGKSATRSFPLEDLTSAESRALGRCFAAAEMTEANQVLQVESSKFLRSAPSGMAKGKNCEM